MQNILVKRWGRGTKERREFGVVPCLDDCQQNFGLIHVSTEHNRQPPDLQFTDAPSWLCPTCFFQIQRAPLSCWQRVHHQPRGSLPLDTPAWNPLDCSVAKVPLLPTPAWHPPGTSLLYFFLPLASFPAELNPIERRKGGRKSTRWTWFNHSLESLETYPRKPCKCILIFTLK